MFIKRIFAIIIILTIAVYGCGSIDLSTPEKSVESLYYAISKRDAELYAKCFYEGGEFKIGEIKLAARRIFDRLKVVKYGIIRREDVGTDEVKLTIEQVSETRNRVKIVSTFIVTYIKIGKEWKVLKVQDIETKQVE